MNPTMRMLDTGRIDTSFAASTWYIDIDVPNKMERAVESEPILDDRYMERGRRENLGPWRPWRAATREYAAAWAREQEANRVRERAELESRAVALVERLISESVARLTETPALQRWDMGASVVEADRAALLADGRIPAADVDAAIRAGSDAVWRAVAFRAYMTGHSER